MSRQILVVEDNEMNMELTTELLEICGYEVTQATHAEDGIELACQKTFDLVLMDVSLPGLDGLTATRRILERLGDRAMPIVALTAHAMRGDAEKARQSGCCGHITKPIEMHSFIQAVESYLAPAVGQ